MEDLCIRHIMTRIESEVRPIRYCDSIPDDLELRVGTWWETAEMSHGGTFSTTNTRELLRAGMCNNGFHSFTASIFVVKGAEKFSYSERVGLFTWFRSNRRSSLVTPMANFFLHALILGPLVRYLTSPARNWSQRTGRKATRRQVLPTSPCLV